MCVKSLNTRVDTCDGLKAMPTSIRYQDAVSLLQCVSTIGMNRYDRNLALNELLTNPSTAMCIRTWVTRGYTKITPHLSSDAYPGGVYTSLKSPYWTWTTLVFAICVKRQPSTWELTCGNGIGSHPDDERCLDGSCAALKSPYWMSK